MSTSSTTITIQQHTAQRLRLVGATLGKTDGETIDFLLDRLTSQAPPPGTPAASGANPVPIHVVYKGTRVDGTYDPSTQTVTITSTSLAGNTYPKPSPAARDVVAMIDPGVNPARNGWGFWTVTDTGKTLESRRHG